jgi:hypothetical protein
MADELPGFIPRVLQLDDVSLLRADEAVLNAMVDHLRPVLAALEARLGTLNELTQTTPIAILAETLGYSPQTLEAHARASASTYARYVATRLD